MPRKKTDYVESLRDAAKQTGIALPLLQAARAAGCPAFKGSRVRLDILREWIDENADVLASSEAEGTEDLLSLKRKLLRQQIKRSQEQTHAARLANEETEKQVVRIDETTQTIVRLASEFNGLVRIIEDSLPQALAGLGLPEQRLKIREMFDKMRAKIYEPLAEYRKAQAVLSEKGK